MEWTDELIARLRALWQEGLSTAEIGRRMGITKNAVVGKAHRLDLPARPSPIRKTDAGQPASQPKRPVAAEKPRTPAPVMTPPAAEIAAVEVPVADPAPIAVQAPAVAVEPVVSQPAPAPVEIAAPDNVRLLRPEMPNPAVVPVPREEPAPVAQRPEPVRAVSRPVEPREPRRRGLTCCWPLGEPGTKGFHFCGADPAPGKPYCAEHAALAYVKLRDRRDSVA